MSDFDLVVWYRVRPDRFGPRTVEVVTFINSMSGFNQWDQVRKALPPLTATDTGARPGGVGGSVMGVDTEVDAGRQRAFELSQVLAARNAVVAAGWSEESGAPVWEAAWSAFEDSAPDEGFSYLRRAAVWAAAAIAVRDRLTVADYYVLVEPFDGGAKVPAWGLV